MAKDPDKTARPASPQVEADTSPDKGVRRSSRQADAGNQKAGTLPGGITVAAGPGGSVAAPAEGFLTGQLLVAMPAMADPRFAQSVIYVCAHTADGAMGLVVNRPIVRPTFDDLLRQLDVAPVPPMRRIRLCAGGPVENGRGFVLHTVDWTGEGSLRVDSALALTASLDVLKAIAGGGGPREGLLALGLCRLGTRPARQGDAAERLALGAGQRDVAVRRRPRHQVEPCPGDPAHRPAAAIERRRSRLNGVGVNPSVAVSR